MCLPQYLDIKEGEVWFVKFPLEENPNSTINRPIIVLDVDRMQVLSVKITKHKPRKKDLFDYPIIQWKKSGLKFKSTARIGKVLTLNRDCFIFKIGTLIQSDMNKITELYINYISTQSTQQVAALTEE